MLAIGNMSVEVTFVVHEAASGLGSIRSNVAGVGTSMKRGRRRSVEIVVARGIEVSLGLTVGTAANVVVSAPIRQKHVGTPVATSVAPHEVKHSLGLTVVHMANIAMAAAKWLSAELKIAA
mmetsp:Transcript_92465/g.261206  ORF Transcript_92465/g.261206 Transcript_92465/m.261206 type:complete len:121 (+) Transcript_92465:947-1309(+)